MTSTSVKLNWLSAGEPNMKNFGQGIQDIYKSLDSILLFEDILNAIIVFLASFLILMLMRIMHVWNVHELFGILPALGYLAYVYKRDFDKKRENEKLIVVEHVNPALSEKLRTAADNLYLENAVVAELQEDKSQGSGRPAVVHRDYSHHVFERIIPLLDYGPQRLSVPDRGGNQ